MDYLTRPLSHAQMGLWLHHQKRPTGSEYNLPVELRIKAPFDIAALRCALQLLIDRHEMLRTTFHQEGEHVVQRIPEKGSLSFHVVRQQKADEAAFHQSIAAEARSPFDLEHGPVFRAHLFIGIATEEILLLNFHHIISDGYSIRTFLSEFGRLYQACCGNTDMPDLTTAASYGDFVAWQERLLASDDGERMWAYWRNQFDEHEPELVLPTDRPRPALATHTGSVFSLDIGVPLVTRLERLARKEKVTLATVLLAAYYVLLHRYGDQDDITLYVPRLGRPERSFSETFGYFVSLGALRQDLSGNPIFLDHLQRVRHLMRCARTHEYFPLPLLLEKLKLSPATDRNPLAQAVFNFIPESVSSLAFIPCDVDLSGLPAQMRLCETDIWIDLDFRILAGKEGARLYVVYNADLWDRSTIERLAKHYQLLLEAIADAPARRIGDYSLLTPEEEHQILHSWNETAAPFPSDICLHNLIEAQADTYPDNIAVSCPLEALSYAVLEQRANRLARHLISKGVRRGDVVGVLLERSCDLIVGFLAILKAGAVYLPLDSRLPGQRLRFMLRDAGAITIISKTELNEQTFGRDLSGLNVEGENRCAVVLLDKERTEIALHKVTPPRCPAGPSDLAYVIYTSGSTGQPKGVMVEHRSACNMAEDLRRTYQLGPDSRVLQFASCGFDASLFDFMLALTSGGRLCLAPPSASLPGEELVEFMRRERITAAGLTPTAWTSLPSTDLPDLTVIKSGGEPLPSSLIERWGEKRHIFNSYGPTETTVYCIRTEVKAEEQRPPIGRPGINTKAYILDRYGNPAPVGAIGELYIGGVGIGRGYINRDELTRELFRPNPFDDEPQSRVYRTGDRARYRSDGTIEFLGRKDEQIKIRGMRVELAEIEHCLMEHENVKACCVTLTDGLDQNASLTAYVVRRRENSRDTNELQFFLRAALPGYMIPSHFVFLPELPTNRSGKIDRRALPQPSNANLKVATLPTAGLQTELAEIWKGVLKLESVGVEDNFFDVGGHSLAVVQVQARIHDRLGIDCKILDFFEHPTIRTLAAHLAATPNAPPSTEDLKNTICLAGSGNEPKQDRNSIAIIGMAGRFPGAENVDQFWNNLVEGIESIADLDEQTLREASVDPNTFGKPNYVRREAVISGVDLFDAAFFGLSPKEAAWMDPQQRILLETAYQALDHAGCGSRENAEGRVGVFAGVGPNHYLAEREAGRDLLDSEKLQIRILNGHDFTATRIAYKLNLSGPCVSVQTACSTSLVAVHLACQSLRSNECDMALAGGASISLPQGKGYLHQQGHILSPDGHCRAFDAKAQGTVRGSGAAVVVLKRLSDAWKDGDYVWAVIKGSAINNDGAGKVGFTAPSADGQGAVIQAALTDADVSADTIGYVEAHGTGTYLGDPIEISGLTKAFRSHTAKKQFCAIGSVKTNIGHLDTAAGVTGLIKLAIMLKKSVIPASLHFDKPNPNVDFQESPVFVNKTCTAWPRGSEPRRGGVSSFGIGGTNAHTILEEAPPRSSEQGGRRLHVFPVSGASRPAQTEMLRRLADFMRRSDVQHCAANIAYTLQKGRAALRYRSSFVGSDLAQLADQLDQEALNAGGSREASNEHRIVFMFSGQGGQQIGMGRELYEEEPVFRSAIDECAKWLNEFAHVDFRPLLYREGKSVSTLETQLEAVMQPVIFATQYAMAKLFMSWGIFPAAVIGHSIGEYAAAYFAGIISLPDAIRLTFIRGQLTSRVPAGGVVVVGLSPEELQPHWNESLSLAAINGPHQCVISGAASEIAAFHEQLQAKSIASKQIRASHAVHSSLLDPILPEFGIHAEQIELHAPQIPFMSTVLGDWLEADAPLDGSYWIRNLRETVQFHRAFDRLVHSGHELFIEMGPGAALMGHSKRSKSKINLPSPIAFAALQGGDHGQGDRLRLLQTLGKLWTCGVPIDWSGLHERKPPQRNPLPPYPFDRKRYWLDAVAPKEQVQNADLNQHDIAARSVDRPSGNEAVRSPTVVEMSADAALDSQIAAVYRDILGLDDVALTDSFFDLGGDSLSALSAIDRIEQLTGERLAVSLLLEHQTPRGLAMALSKTVGSTRPDALVPIQAGGSRTPLFCPHPFGGHVLLYTPLANALGAEQPVFGLQARGLDGRARPHLSIPEMAGAYVEAIKSIQPRGPYQLAGLSMGGSIAWEMACQLRDTGDEVAILALLDAKALHKPEEDTSGRYHRLLGNNPIPDWLSEQAVILTVLFPALKKHWRKLKSIKSERQVTALLEFGTQAGKVPDMSDTQLDHILTVAEANRTALHHYTPRPNDSRSVLFAAKKGLRISTNQPDGDLGWKQFARGRLEIHEVPGDHYTMVAPPHVNVMAKKLNKFLNGND
ncbi:MAG: amino acid adenylation domain-containing protein [Mesorhizobium sp.]|uniref:non-ribosomal peptide synthetase/type I polyketide synthase n=1 Tax=Mesorhizobium sp. TaxID=1871066 RepID=UPI000FE54F8D|nr:non-ribosomal peptide synthetase/type I polyketide synthase [Mesorhizobium sp.]RWI36994.1 MAG: amino acid adenylation domain-containing protein [Mesorhizobium sp.]RWI63293.1 MAG: amino acid adenylation domain-containing protein [Mesorhizobium sp.]RWI82567.1 MAG: amino acid adenylation domain-containing protein [Mesorhizobium sp.]RWJ46744.1 MAG: amino acid adenylation domain-containing protein [Mesorhizobium sp.]RWJ57485.1 MAG: amino acid adenylation domain-containing protein [Mesorhizobium 